MKNTKNSGGQSDAPPPHPVVFFQNLFSRERVKPWFFVTFKVIISQIFPENSTEISQVIQEI